jgi:hypothetical protein
MSEGPIAAAPNPPAPPFPPYPPYAPFPPYPPYPPVVLQFAHGHSHCGCGGGGHAAPAATPPSYTAPPSYVPPAVPPSYVPPVPGGTDTHTATPVVPGTVTNPTAPGGFNPFDPLGSLTGLLGSIFGGKR